MRRPTIVFSLVVMAMMGGSTVAAGAKSAPAPTWKVQGAGQFTTAGGLAATRNFHLQWSSASGLKPGAGVEVKVVDPVTHQQLRHWKGTITCFVPISSNEVVFGGQVTMDQGNPPDEVVGDFFEWHLVDNGNNNNQAPFDMIGSQRGPTPTFGDCNGTPPAATQPLDSGQILIH